MRKSILAGRVALFLFCAALAHAAVPLKLNYQGAYREGGIPVSGVRTMTFRLTNVDGTVEHWTSGPTSITVSTGIFRTVFTLPSSLDWGGVSPFIEVSVGATTLLPRDPLSSSIYAVHAATAEKVSDGAIVDASVAAGAAIAPAKIAGTAMTLSQPEIVIGAKTFNANLLMGSGSIGAADVPGVTFSTHVFIPGAGSLGIGTSGPAGPLHVRSVGQDALFVSPVNAFVGLGTVTPAERLEVKNGSIKLTGIGASIVFADNTVMNSASLGSANAVTNANDLLIQGDSDANGGGDILFKTGPNERVRVANNGYVGVGTAVPAAKLHLALPSVRDLAFSANAGGSWMVGLPTGGNASVVNDQAVSVYAGGDGTAVGGVANNPHKGLGAALTLYGNDNAKAGTAELSASGATGAVLLKTAASERARITSSGNLGLGTSSPGAKLDVEGNAQFGAGAAKSTFTATGALDLASNAGVALTGPTGYISSQSSVTASAFFGNGAGLTGTSATNVTAAGVQAGALGAGVIASSIAVNAVLDDSIVSVSGAKVTGAIAGGVAKAGDTMTGQLTLSGSTLTVTGNAFSVGGSSFTVAGGSATVAYRLTAGSFAGDGTALTGVVSAGSVQKTGDTMTGQLTNTSTITVQGNAFSVGDSTFVVTGGRVGIGTTTPRAILDVVKTSNVPWDGQFNFQLSNNSALPSWPSSPVLNLIRSRGTAAAPTAVLTGNTLGTLQFVGHDGTGLIGGALIHAVATENWSGAGSGAALAFDTIANGTWNSMLERMRIDNSGNVGIGTVNPVTTLDVNGNAQFGSGAVKSTFTTTGALTLASNAGVTLTGPTAYITSQSSVTASAFFGSGAGLTGVSGATDASRVLKAGDTMTGQLTITGSSHTIVDTNVGGSGDAFSLAVTTAADRSVYHLVVSTNGNVGIGTATPASKLHVDGIITAGGLATGVRGDVDAGINVNALGSGNRYAYVDLVGDDTYADFGLRIIRYNTGPNADSAIHHNGTGNLTLGTSAGASHILMAPAGNVGVGTTAPGAKLDVNGGTVFRSSSTWTGAAVPVVSAAGQGALYFDSAQNKFLVSENGGGYQPLGGAGSYVAKAGDTMTGQLTIAGSSLTVRSNAAASPLLVSTSPTAGVVGLYVDVANNVGIGTANPGAKLEVRDDANALNRTLTVRNDYATAGSAGSRIGFGTYRDVDANSLGAAIDAINTAGVTNGNLAQGAHLTFNTAADGVLGVGERMRITNVGNVGIGEAVPGSKLHVAGRTQITDGVAAADTADYGTFGVTRAASPDALSYIVMTRAGSVVKAMGIDSANSWLFGLAQSPTQLIVPQMAIDVAGNVGIGTTGPRSKLEVTSGAANTNADIPGIAANFTGPTPSGQGSSVSLESNDAIAADTGGVLGFGGRYSGTPYANWASIKGLKADATAGNYGGYLSFFTRLNGAGSAERMRIDTNGNVGISTGNPTAALDVNGGTVFRSSSTWTGAAAPVVSVAGQGALYFDSTQNKFLVSENGGGYQPLGNAGSNVAKTGDTMTGQLTIAGSSLTVRSNAAASPLLVSTSPTAGVVGLYVDVANKVGVGTAAPGAALHVYEPTLLGGTAGNSQLLTRIGGVSFNSFLRSLWLYRDSAGTDWTTTRLHDGISVDASFLTPGTDTKTWWERDPNNNIQSWGNAAATYMTINNGAVGIGTTAPRSTLEVVSGAANTNADIPGIAANFTGPTPSGQGSSVSLESNDAIAADTGGVLAFGGRYSGTTYANWASIKGLKADAVAGNFGGYLAFFTRLMGSWSAERMRIDTNGNVGIGLTNPSHQLHVGEADGTSNLVSIRGYSNSPTSWKGGAAFGYTGASVIMGELSGIAQIGGHNAALNAWGNLAINSAGGNVGIGTTAPATLLDVNGNAQFGSGAAKSTFTTTGALTLASNAGVTLTGPTAYIASQSSVTASAFFGSGAGLTGVTGATGTDSSKVAKTGDTMTGALTLPADPTTALQAATKQYVDAATAETGACPTGMAYIPGPYPFCIDKYEAYLLSGSVTNCTCTDGSQAEVDACASTAVAGSAAGQTPLASINWCAAKKACQNAGKHLLTNSEWFNAANYKGSKWNITAEQSAEAMACNTGTAAAALTGASATCVTQEGVYDMIGNVLEWVDFVMTANPTNGLASGSVTGYDFATGIPSSVGAAAPAFGDDYYYAYDGAGAARALLRGGSWASIAYAGVFTFNATSGPSTASIGAGFRCGRRR